MNYLQYKLSTSDLDGIKITFNITIFHHLFANGVGIFIPTEKNSFAKLQEALTLYKLASWAKLNLVKLVIIPLALQMAPQWLHDTDCSISKLSEIHKYLGTPLGTQLKRTKIYNFYLDRISKIILGWESRLLL